MTPGFVSWWGVEGKRFGEMLHSEIWSLGAVPASPWTGCSWTTNPASILASFSLLLYICMSLVRHLREGMFMVLAIPFFLSVNSPHSLGLGGRKARGETMEAAEGAKHHLGCLEVAGEGVGWQVRAMGRCFSSVQEGKMILHCYFSRQGNTDSGLMLPFLPLSVSLIQPGMDFLLV